MKGGGCGFGVEYWVIFDFVVIDGWVVELYV